LKIGEASFSGKSAVAEMAKFKTLKLPESQQNFVAQPYGQKNEVIVTVPLKGEEVDYVMTFVLANVGEGNRFGITQQIIHRDSSE
jgi:hypothetical protein